MQPFFLHSERLRFRPWHEGDLDAAIALWGDADVTRYIDGRGKLTTKQVQGRLMMEITTAQAHQVQYWPVFLHDEVTLVGCCGLHPYEPEVHTYELGFHIRVDFWNQGFATEAARAVMRHAFDTLQARALYAGHHPDNVISRRLMDKLGFTYLHDAYYAPTNTEHPTYRLSARAYQRLTTPAS